MKKEVSKTASLYSILDLGYRKRALFVVDFDSENKSIENVGDLSVRKLAVVEHCHKEEFGDKILNSQKYLPNVRYLHCIAFQIWLFNQPEIQDFIHQKEMQERREYPDLIGLPDDEFEKAMLSRINEQYLQQFKNRSIAENTNQKLSASVFKKLLSVNEVFRESLLDMVDIKYGAVIGIKAFLFDSLPNHQLNLCYLPLIFTAIEQNYRKDYFVDVVSQCDDIDDLLGGLGMQYHVPVEFITECDRYTFEHLSYQHIYSEEILKTLKQRLNTTVQGAKNFLCKQPILCYQEKMFNLEDLKELN